MTIEEAREYWNRRIERAESYSDEHWDAEERRAHADYVEAMTHAITALAICREHEEVKQPKSNEEHNAAYWMQKTMDAAHEAYDRLKDTVDFKNAIAEVEAIKQRMGLGEKKKITNADRIRQMTDEELAVFMIVQALMGAASANGISDRQSAENLVKEVIKSKSAEIDIENAKDWLKQEVSRNDKSRVDTDGGY